MDLRVNFSSLLLLLLFTGLCAAQQAESQRQDKEIPFDASEEEDMTSAILRMNNGSTDFLLEGDLLIPRTRTAMRCYHKTFSCLWPKSANGQVEVPFTISPKYTATEKRMILSAMRDFHANTCIRFVGRQRERMYLSIEPKYGCFSSLGRIGDKQVLSLAKYGCVQNGVIQHELLHALGFYHEHTRSDRDNYVRINWDNIRSGYKMNFKKMNTNNLNTPYDYSSVMHYGRAPFAIDHRSDTITPFPNPNVYIGQRRGMSNMDILRVNKLYKCHDN
ncbi:low choriolytic enzyme-like [Genypterus blacodes]|uniref:low choriolytic enzyme-like n=1 Tax=Genypterus blacodes TaxID=154954 RepID=UPI003F75EAC8